MNWDLFRPSKSTAVCLLLLFVSFLLMTFRLTSFVRTLRLFLQYWVSPSYEISSDLIISSKGLGVRIAELVSAHEENRVLKEKIKQFSIVESELNEALNENMRLREILNLKSSHYYRSLPARVIGRDPQNWIQSVIIDGGSEDGVAQNSAVLAIDGNPVVDSKVFCSVIGRVMECGPDSSKVLLISDPLSSVTVAISRNGEQGLLQGQGSYLVMMEYLNQMAEVQVGDEVVTSGLGGVFPSGLPVGKIKKIISSSSGFKKAELSLIVPLSRFREVFVLTQSDLKQPALQEERFEVDRK